MPENELASFRENSLCVVHRCAATPPGGLPAEVVTVEQMQKENDLSGKMVFIRTQYPNIIRREVQDKNGVGIISAFSFGALDIPDHACWINGW